MHYRESDHLEELILQDDARLHFLQVDLDRRLGPAQHDAEDEIISYLNEHKMLLEAALIKGRDTRKLVSQSRKMIDFLRKHRDGINERIKDRAGFVGTTSK